MNPEPSIHDPDSLPRPTRTDRVHGAAGLRTFETLGGPHSHTDQTCSRLEVAEYQGSARRSWNAMAAI